MSDSVRTTFLRWMRFGAMLALVIWSADGMLTQVSLAQESSAPRPSIDALTTQLADENSTARRKAAQAILDADQDLQVAILPKLVSALGKENDVQIRLSILETFRRLGPVADVAVPVLLDAMKSEYGNSGDEKKHQIYRTALTLAAIGHPSVDGLRTLLTHSKEGVRAESAMALGRIGPPASEATDGLIAMLDDKSDRVSQEAAIALGKLGEGTLDALLRKMQDAPPVVQSRILESFGQMNRLSTPARDAVSHAANHNEPIVRAAALRIIEKCDLSTEDVGEILVKGLQHADERVRLAAVNVLVTRKDLIRNRQSDIATLLSSTDARIAAHAAFVITKLGRDAAPALIDSLQGEVGHVEIVGDALGGLEASIQPWLVDKMVDSNSRVRQAAARALGRVRPANSSGLDRLRRGLSDDDRLVQAACLESLGALGPRAEDAQATIREKLSDSNEEIRLLAVDVLFTISRNEQTVDDLRRLAEDPSEKVQLKAIQLLRAVGPIGRSAIPAVSAKLLVSDAGIRLAATEYLRSHGPFAADALPSLTEMLDDSSPQIRLASVKTIAQLRSAAMPAYERLAGMLKDEDAEVRGAALSALSATGAEFDQLQPHLVFALNGNDKALQTESLRLIGRIGKPAAVLIPQIIALADKDDKRRTVERALRGFQRTGPLPESIPALIELVNHKETSVRKLAIEYLGLAGTSARDAIPALEQLKDDPAQPIQEAAAAALKKIQGD